MSFTDLTLASLTSETETLIPDLLIGAKGNVQFPLPYMLEPYLAQWFKVALDEMITVWMFANTGAVPLATAYRKLVEHLKIDALILVDGGVDSIMQGNEVGSGTILEDSITLTAVDTLDLPIKLLVCIGFGTEVEEQVCHYHALENIAALSRAGGFYGNCALLPSMTAFQQHEAACLYVWEQPRHSKSHISTRIIPAAHGIFGNHRLYPDEPPSEVLISPLMSLYWFFDVPSVIQRNLLVEQLRTTHSKDEARAVVTRHIRQLTRFRPRRPLPY